jgi:hypothetical protein
MSACIGASAAGGRVATATSSQGMALMWEMLHIASGYRLPILMALVNRALSAPLNIHGDHSDGMGMRDCGWIQLFCENAQEAYDNTIMAYRIAEHKDVRLPIAVNMDGFIISHSIESMQFLADDEVKKFVGDYIARSAPRYRQPQEHRRPGAAGLLYGAQAPSMRPCERKKVIQDVSAASRIPGGMTCSNHTVLKMPRRLVALNSAAGTIMTKSTAIRERREGGP